MTLTKERKLYVAVLGLGLVALVGDTLFFSDPSAASGAQPPLEGGVEDASPASGVDFDAAAIEARLQSPENSIRHHLDRVGRQHGMVPGLAGDAFARPVSWPGQEPALESAQKRPEPPGFADLHRLAAVMAGAGGGVATLHGPGLENGRATIRVGQSISGYQLVELDGRSAVFEGPDGRVRLELQDPAGAGAPGDSPR